MKAAAFRYARATSAAHAQALLAEHGEDARLLAGGQSLLAALNLRLSEPAILVDMGRIGQADITAGDERLRLGALATHAAIGRSATVAEAAPMLAQAVPHIAHPAIRNRGTIGGSLALGDPAAEWPACALALGAEIVLGSAARGERRCRRRRSSLASTARLAPRTRWCWRSSSPSSRRTSDRSAWSWPGAAAITRWSAFRRARWCWTAAGLALRAAFFGVGATPVLAREAVRAAEGAPVAEAARAAANALGRDLDPPGDPTTDGATRLRLARVLLRRAVVAMAS